MLWCIDPKSSKFITSRDVTFDGSAMFHKENESASIDIEINQGECKQVELKVRASETMQENASIKEVVQDIVVKNAPKKLSYSIATERQKRQIKTLIKYGYANLVDFSLNVIKNLDDHKFCSYKEVVSWKESS